MAEGNSLGLWTSCTWPSLPMARLLSRSAFEGVLMSKDTGVVNTKLGIGEDDTEILMSL